MADGSKQQPEAPDSGPEKSPLLGATAHPDAGAQPFDEEAAVQELLPGAAPKPDTTNTPEQSTPTAEAPSSKPPTAAAAPDQPAAQSPLTPLPTLAAIEPPAKQPTHSEESAASSSEAPQVPTPEPPAEKPTDSVLTDDTDPEATHPAVRITPIAPLDTQSSPLVVDRGVSVTGLAIRTGRRQIIEEATFTAAAGEVTALVGRVGSGKTAALLALATLLRPSAGELRMCGIDLVRQPTDAHGLFGWAPQRPPAWSGVTVRQCLVSTARLLHYSRAEGRDRADVLIDLVGLTGLESTRVAVLSPAHQQLVSLAASLLSDPQVVLVDEPTSGLDHPTAAHITSVLRALAAEGKAVLVTSQADETITDWTDRQYFLVNGVTATPEEVSRSLHSPRSWSIRTTEIISLVDTLRSMRLPFSADENSGVATIVLENADAAALLLSKLSDVPITEYAPTLSTAEHIISTLEEERHA